MEGELEQARAELSQNDQVLDRAFDAVWRVVVDHQLGAAAVDNACVARCLSCRYLDLRGDCLLGHDAPMLCPDYTP